MVKIKKFDLLVALYIYCIAISELMGGKTFPLVKLFGYQFNASVAIFVIPLVFTINDVIVEVFGKARARSVVLSGFVIIFLIFLFSILATALPPSSRFAATNAAYRIIFGISARISASSLTAFLISDLMDILIFVKMREVLGKKALWLRTNVSNLISEFFDTAIFMTLAFYAFDKGLSANASFLWSLILPYWLIKCVMSVVETPFVYLGVNWLRPKSK